MFELVLFKKLSQDLYKNYCLGIISLDLYISQIRELDKQIDQLELKVLSYYLDNPAL